MLPKEAKGQRVGRQGRKGREKLSRGQAEGAASEHGGGEPGHDRLSLDVKISVEFVGPPASNHADAFAGDAGTQKGHGPWPRRHVWNGQRRRWEGRTDQEVAEFCLFKEDFGRKYMWSCGILSFLEFLIH
jgi:hypothetical protein